MFQNFQPPGNYTGEVFGVLYLYQQTGRILVRKDQDLDSLIDEGFEVFTEDESPAAPTSTPETGDPTVVAPATDENSDDEEVIVNHFFSCAHYTMSTCM